MNCRYDGCEYYELWDSSYEDEERKAFGSSSK